LLARRWSVASVVLLAGCGAKPFVIPDAGAPASDAASAPDAATAPDATAAVDTADDRPRFPATTTWKLCGTLVRLFCPAR
jgi:hypothetical protein